MKVLLLVLVLTALGNYAKASTYTVSLKTIDKIEQSAVDNALPAQLKELVECIIESGEKALENTSCINEVLGDIHN